MMEGWMMDGWMDYGQKEGGMEEERDKSWVDGWTND